MKISTAWLSDHLKPYASQRIMATDVVQHMIELLERSSIEIDVVEEIVIDLDNVVLASVQHVDEQHWILYNDEYNKEYRLPIRPDYDARAYYFLYRGEDGVFQYAKYIDLGGVREGFMPPVMVDKQDAQGAWKKSCDLVDYRLTIDNKAITHRPDMWSHRGMAREIAALLSCEMVPLCDMIASCPVVQVEDTQQTLIRTPACDYFTRLSISPVTCRMSPPWLALRLMRIDSKPINLFVDATNYVMFDIGQPLHVFDSDTVQGDIRARQAHPGESLTLLDGRTLTLRAEDCVIADQKRALSLAGIMGGQASGFSAQTQSMILESAHFDPIAIRASATAHQIRTEGSSRWEKGLDPILVIPGAQRYLYLLQNEGITVAHDIHIAVVYGSLPDPYSISITHEYIERKIGIAITAERVISLLKALGIVVHIVQHDPTVYEADIPSWRRRDINIQEDLVEEIARMIGYDAITPRLPLRSLQPASFQQALHMRRLKHFCAYGWRMQEVHNYAFYDEQFLREGGLMIDDAIPLKNPVSEQWRRLVSSLIPHFLKNIAQNIPEHEEIRLFEINETWRQIKNAQGSGYDSRTTLACLWYTHKKTVNFYEGMKIIQSLSDTLHIPLQIQPWDDNITPEQMPWYDSVQRAYITTASGMIIGTIGMIDRAVLGKIAEGAACGIELNAHAIINSISGLKRYRSVSKFPRVVQDLSIMVPYHLKEGGGTVAALQRDLKALDMRIVAVSLVDFFEKDSWKDARSLTFRFIISDDTKTLTRQEIDAVMDRVKAFVIAQGASVR